MEYNEKKQLNRPALPPENQKPDSVNKDRSVSQARDRQGGKVRSPQRRHTKAGLA